MDIQEPTGTLKPASLLAAKLVLMMGEVSHIPKTGHNSAQHYDYATEADVVAACRKALIKHGVSMIPSLKYKEYTPVVSKQGANGFLVSVTMTYKIVDAESGESDTFDMPGDGMDYGDKGLYKAITGAEKYALLKLLHLPTGDDPEQDAAHDKDQPLTQKTFAEKYPDAVYSKAPLPIVPPGGSQAPSARVPWTVPDTKSNQQYKIAGWTASQLKDVQLDWFLHDYQKKINTDPQSKYRDEWESAVLDIEEEIALRRDGLVLR